MDKKLQDLNWSRLPKESREYIKNNTDFHSNHDSFGKGYHCALSEVFGHHNLTSDTEPDEIDSGEKNHLISVHIPKE